MAKRSKTPAATRAPGAHESAQSVAPRVRKSMRLDQRLLDQARRALGAADETEAVTIALRRVVSNDRAAAAIRAIAGRMQIDESRIED